MTPIDQIPYLVELHEWKNARVYTLAGDQVLFIKDRETPQLLISELTKFLNKWAPDLYTVKFSTSYNVTEANLFVHYFDTRVIVDQKEAQATVQIEPSHELIQGMVETELKNREETAKFNEYQAERERFETMGGKLSVLLDIVVKNYMPDMMGAQTVQGETQTVSTDQEQYQKACEILTSLVDSDLLLKMALRIEKDPAVLNTLKTFL